MKRNVHRYLVLWNILDDLCERGRGESRQAENLRNKMDVVWRNMNGDEIDEVKTYLKGKKART